MVPSPAAIERLCAELRRVARREAHRRLTEGLSAEQRRGLDALTQRRKETSLSWLAWLRQMPEAATPAAMLGLIERLEHIRRIGIEPGRGHLIHQARLAQLALETLGERESGTARLEQAVAAYRAALEERTRARAPLDWAMTQNNLGNALETLGERESGTARLEEAAAAYRAALEEWTRERVPLQWAMTQNNLGLALETLGERESGTARLEQAVAAYRAALHARARPAPMGDNAEQSGPCARNTRRAGERDGAAGAGGGGHRAALEERTRERVPLDWADSLGNQGVALVLIADRTNDVVVAETAVRQIETAYEMLTGAKRVSPSASISTRRRITSG